MRWRKGRRRPPGAAAQAGRYRRRYALQFVVRLAVCDVLGREVARLGDGVTEAGSPTAVFDASIGAHGT